MKLKVYKLAAMALVCLTVLGAQSFAQQSSSSSSTTNTPAPAASGQSYGTQGYNNSAYSGNGYQFNYPAMAPVMAMDEQYGLSQDTTYQKKMQKLQEQMRELQKQMSGLRTEEMKKNSAEMSKRMAEMNQRMAESFKNFSQKSFSNMGQSFNFEKNDADLEKKAQAGEIKLKTKAYTKSYAVDKDDKLQIENYYGKVTVNTWNKNEVKVDVEIKAYANDDDAAQKLLDIVKITDSKDNNLVAFKTVIGDNDHWGTWTTNGKTTVRKTVINYIVYMPEKSALTLSNSYGSVILPELSGKLNIKNSFGSLTTKALLNPDNTITVRYGSADIESLVGSDLKVAYGSLDLKSANKLNAEISYSPAKIGTINNTGIINLHYGTGLQIDNLGKNLKSLSVKAQYAPVKLGSLTNDNADFDVTVQYGGFNYDNGVSVTSKSPDDGSNYRWNYTQNYKGHIGKGSADKLITIKSSYSSVKFDQ